MMVDATFELRCWKHTALGDGWRTQDNSDARFDVGYARGRVILMSAV
jgi:hypothetical protein